MLRIICLYIEYRINYLFINHILCVYKSVPYQGNLINFDDSKADIEHND